MVRRLLISAFAAIGQFALTPMANSIPTPPEPPSWQRAAPLDGACRAAPR